MGGEQSRRRFLSAGLAIGIAPNFGRWSHGSERLSNELRIESDGGGFAAYEFTITESVRQVDDDDQVMGNRVWGHVGPERGADTFEYAGDIAGFVLAGPATVFRNGRRLRLGGFPHPTGSLRSSNFHPDSGTSVLRVESDGGGVAAYEFSVTGSLAQRDDDDQVTGRRAWGHVGPKRGADTFEFTGDVTRFALAGPASVFLDGSEVTRASNGPDRGLVSANPDPEVTVAPDTTVLFEAVAPDHADEFLRTDWYFDGQEYVGPDAFYGHMEGRGRGTMTYAFESPGTHEVRVEAYERRDSGKHDPHIGTTRWTVRVESEGNRAPSVESMAPDGPVTVSRDSSEPRTFEVTARDPEGELDRVVWWETQCDYVVDVSTVTGDRDTATLTHAPSAGCPLAVRVIDRDGAVSGLDGWRYERPD